VLKPAILYADELLSKMKQTWYDPKYFSYYSEEMYLPDLGGDPKGRRDFVSVDDNDNVIGYFSYQIDRRINGAYNFGIMSFNMGNPTFVQDIRQGVDEIFTKYHLNRMDWMCYASNPALRGYRKFIKRHGGREVGKLTQAAMTADGILQDVYLFEIMAKDYLRAKNTVLYLVEGDSANDFTNIDIKKYGSLRGRVVDSSKKI